MPPCLLSFLHRWSVVSEWRERLKRERKSEPFSFHFFSSLRGRISPIAQHASLPMVFVFVGRLPYWGQGVARMGGSASVQTDDSKKWSWRWCPESKFLWKWTPSKNTTAVCLRAFEEYRFKQREQRCQCCLRLTVPKERHNGEQLCRSYLQTYSN